MPRLTSERLALLEAKVHKYEQFLHLIQMHAEVTMDENKLRNLIGRACTWSYAHRRGNGELSDEQQRMLIDDAFSRLTNTGGIRMEPPSISRHETASVLRALVDAAESVAWEHNIAAMDDAITAAKHLIDKIDPPLGTVSLAPCPVEPVEASTLMEKVTVRYRRRRNSSPPEGLDAAWDEWQVLSGKSVVSRHDTEANANTAANVLRNERAARFFRPAVSPEK